LTGRRFDSPGEPFDSKARSVTNTASVEEHKTDGVRLRVSNPAKTVADCFKFRYKIGVDVAMETLRDPIRQRRATVGDEARLSGSATVYISTSSRDR
jgi:predicted transcriptional regulator of viral defense system